MSPALKPYQAMKDSGVAWLGEVPKHWELRRFKYVLRERDARSTSGAEQLLRVSQYTGVTERKRDDGGEVPDTRAESLVGYKLVEPGDLVVNIMLAWNGSMGVSAFAGIASPAYCVYRFGRDVQPWYFHRLLRTPTYKARIKALSTGVVESRLRLYTDDLYRMEALVPPPEEQAAIVRFLDHADRKIRRAIRAKQKLVKLLEEEKQAIIHRAVTRGLDPTVRLKPSGVEWLGDVPEHWDIRRLKELTTHIEQGWSPQCDAQPASDDEWGVLKVGCVNGDTLNTAENKRLPASLTPRPELQLSHDDILVSRANTRGLLGLAAVASNPRPKLMLCDKLFRFRALYNVADARFLVYSIRSRQSRAQIESNTNGASDSMQNIGQGVMRNLMLAVPDCDEQVRIAEQIDNQVKAADSSIARVGAEIALLREYRTRLIADVVTGKLDVREAAARLPDVAPEADADDSIDATDDGDQAVEAEGDADADGEAENARA